jgi:hypothetical protein
VIWIPINGALIIDPILKIETENQMKDPHLSLVRPRALCGLTTITSVGNIRTGLAPASLVLCIDVLSVR